MQLQPMSPRQSVVLSRLAGIALGLAMFVWTHPVLRLETDVRRTVAMIFGGMAFGIGCGSTLLWAARRVSSQGVRVLGIAWGLGGTTGGLAALFWAMRPYGPMTVASLLTIALWVIGRVQLSKAGDQVN